MSQPLASNRLSPRAQPSTPLDPAAEGLPFWTKYTVSHTTLRAAAFSSAVVLASLPARGVLHAVQSKHSAAFAGTGITGYTVSVGIVGNSAKYASAFNVFQPVSDTTYQLSSGLFSENFGSATSVLLTAESLGATLDQSTAGSVDVWLLTSIPPA